MELRKIVNDKEKSLRKKSELVSFPLSKEDEETAKYLKDYLVFADSRENQEKYQVRAGVGLAAPQIGVNKKMVCIYINYYKDDKVVRTTTYTLINPKIISHSVQNAYLLTGEGCLSVNEEHEGYVIRYASITVEAYDYEKKENVTLKLRGYEAIVLQHELDHLDGVLFYDRINKKEPFKKIEGAMEL